MNTIERAENYLHENAAESGADEIIKQLVFELRNEIAIVDRIWRALNISNFEQAGGREISEIVADWRRRAETAEDFITGHGYVRCNIPACNCNSWHEGHAERRLAEIYDALGSRTDGKTALDVVTELVEATE